MPNRAASRRAIGCGRARWHNGSPEDDPLSGRDRIKHWAKRHGLGPTALGELGTLVDHLTDDLVDDLVDVDTRVVVVETLELDEPAAAAPSPAAPAAAARYEDLGQLGKGGMGEVRRVRDTALGRVVALKRLHRDLADRKRTAARFLEEAQTTAQLQHPGVVPVHELGRNADGQPFFTMKEVRGRTMSSVLAELHHRSDASGWGGTADGWTFRRLVSALVSVCDTMAYVHAKGVIHRDLKPANIMLGRFGEVLVVDWGLAKVLGQPDEPDEYDVRTARSEDRSLDTQLGTVAGTPAYMPPEQARGEVDRLDARADVYALGAVLYEVLAGRPPYEGHDPYAMLRQVRSGPPEPPERSANDPHTVADFRVGDAFGAERDHDGSFSFGPQSLDVRPETGPPLPRALLQVRARAMAREPEDRHADAGALADDLRAWLDGAHRREHALALVERADALEPELNALAHTAEQLSAAIATAQERIEPWQGEAVKAPLWDLQDRLAETLRTADLKRVERLHTLHAALQVHDRLPEAHERLAAHYRRRHADAEAAGDLDEARLAEPLLRAHVDALPSTHPHREAHRAYLDGSGTLTLHTSPAGAAVELFRYVTRGRRLHPERVLDFGPAPLERVPLPRGSYLLNLSAPGFEDALVPVSIGRNQHWEGVPPGRLVSEPVRLLPAGELAADDRYVPAGWFVSGGDPLAPGSLPRSRLWCDGFVIKRFPVTNREYLAFLNDLAARGERAEAELWVPRQVAAQDRVSGPPLYGRGVDGRYELVPDGDGDTWELDYPVMMVDWHSARAYARWLARRTGKPWRLLHELEREKATRGVDGRAYPWGDEHDPAFSCTRDSHAARRLPAVLQRFPFDESPYGVRGLAGNMRDWCANAFDEAAPIDGRVPRPVDDDDRPVQRAERGGHWTGFAESARAAYRRGSEPHIRTFIISFRVARSID